MYSINIKYNDKLIENNKLFDELKDMLILKYGKSIAFESQSKIKFQIIFNNKIIYSLEDSFDLDLGINESVLSKIDNYIENDEGTAHVEDDEGDIPGKRVERRSKGIRIIPTEEFPNEKEQAWVDLPRGAVVINILHPFYITMKESDRFGKFEKFNIHRVLIEALIKFKNDELKEDWDPRKTLNIFSDLLQKTWSG